MAFAMKEKMIEDSIKEISQKSGEPECILKHRLSMLETYNKMPLPNRVSHLWKYTDPAIFDSKAELKDEIELDIQMTDEAKEKGVIFSNIFSMFKSEAAREKVKEYFGLSTKEEPTKFSLLNEATWSNGYFLYVPSNVKLDSPLIVKLNNMAKDSFASLRVLIILEEGSSLTLIDEIFSNDESNNINVVVEKNIGKNASLKYLNLQANGSNTTEHYFQRAQLEENATLTNLLVSLGGKLLKADLGAKLVGENATFNTYGFVLGDSNQRFDHHTVIRHISPRTNSGLDFRVALKDKARSAYTGNLCIVEEAIECNAYQENRNLLLSSNAKAESIPELEILTDDVASCSHGVTVGQVDEDQLFYLMSRGVERKEAERIVVSGFVEPTISRIPDEQLKEYIRERVRQKLEDL